MDLYRQRTEALLRAIFPPKKAKCPIDLLPIFLNINELYIGIFFCNYKIERRQKKGKIKCFVMKAARIQQKFQIDSSHEEAICRKGEKGLNQIFEIN